MANSNSESTLSGGLLVILGVIVAVVIGYLVYNGTLSKSPNSGPNITVETPAPSAPAAPADTGNQPAPANGGNQ